MSRRFVRITILAEDRRHENLLRHFLLEANFVKNNRDVYVKLCPGGSAEQFVRLRYPVELEELRSRNFQRNLWLIVVVDADTKSVADRLIDLEAGLNSRGVPAPNSNESVVLLVPKRDVETWVWFLLGNVATEDKDYSSRVTDQDCLAAALKLRDCRAADWRFPPNAPSSLVRAGQQLRRIAPTE